MISDAELDRILSGWLAEGPQRAPTRDVVAALGVVATTAQRRGGFAGVRSRWSPSSAAGRITLIAAAILLLIAVMAIGVGAGLIRPPGWLAPAPPPRPAPLDARLQPLHIEDWPVQVSVPSGWTEITTPCCDYRHFAGMSPEGHLSIGHESPFRTAVCSPACQDIQLGSSIPYSAAKQLGELKQSVATIAGSSAWRPLDPGVLDQIDGGVRLDSTGVDDAGRAWHRVYIVGLRVRNVVAIAWSQPTDRFDEGLLDAILASIRLTAAPTYGDGDLVEPPPGTTDFGLPLPGFWMGAKQPLMDGLAARGVQVFGDGRVEVSIGDTDGSLRWCDPDCRELIGQTSLDKLEQSIRAGRDLGPTSPITLGGEPARRMGTEAPVTQQYAIAIHNGRPVAVKIDNGDWDVAPGIPDTMIAGFRFIDPAPVPLEQVFSALGGRVQLALPAAWKRVGANENGFMRHRQRLTVRAGTPDGSIVTCDAPAGPWELCRQVHVANLEELAAAVLPAAIADHGVGPPVASQEPSSLGGEPSVVTHIQAYEYPARSGQEVVYIVAMHDGRPYLLRIWSPYSRAVEVESVIEGFSFVD